MRDDGADVSCVESEVQMNPHKANVTWWIGLSREEFAARRLDRERDLRDSRVGVGAAYASLSDAVPRPRSADHKFAPRRKFQP